MADRLPDEIKAVMENGVPVILATCSGGGVPNATIISQVYYVEPEHCRGFLPIFQQDEPQCTREPSRIAVLNRLSSF